MSNHSKNETSETGNEDNSNANDSDNTPSRADD